MRINQLLGIVVVALVALSGWTYYASVHRAERFERGQKFLPNLNPDEIVEVVIEKGGEETRLRRKEERFEVVSENGYPAANDAVNRFIRNVLDMTLEKEVGSGESLEQRLGFKAEGEDATLPQEAVEVVFRGGADNEMVRFVLGEGAEDASGSYLLRINGDRRDIFLTSQRAFLTTDGDSFLDKAILDVKPTEIAAIRGAGFEIVHEDGEFHLTDVPSGKKESAKVDQAQHILAGLRFVEHHLANDAQLAGLAFPTMVEVALEDDSGYSIALGEKDDKHYLRIQAYHEADRVSIAVDAGDEEVKETAELLERLDEVEKFNRLHGSWIYEVSEGVASKIGISDSDLVEDA